MFNFIKKKIDSGEVYSPVVGRSISLENVPDQMFAQKLMGEGIGFEFDGDMVYAPCDGEIILIADTKHAFGIRSKSGAELLVHVGLDTVALNGEGFEILVKMNDKVKAHEPIIKINRDFMKEKNINLTTPMVITNMDDVEFRLNSVDAVDLNSIVAVVKAK